MNRLQLPSFARKHPTRTTVSPIGVEKGADAAPFLYSSPGPAFVWPYWARTARLAGAYFHPTETDATITARLDQLAAQHVSVIIADSPLGEQFAAWVDDDQFEATRAMMQRVVQAAHALGLKIVMYHTALELISPAERNPAKEHPEWMQRALDGRSILFNDVSNDEEHWLHQGIWDVWLRPCVAADDRQGFRTQAFKRIGAMVLTGIDGLWIDQAYLQSSVGSHHDLWPSSDPCSAAAFKAATALDLPRSPDWGDAVFRRWVVWRHSQIADYLQAEMQMARALNPQIVCLHENSCVDSGRSTYVAADPTSLLGVSGIATAHEVETIADRMDFGATGMQAATLAQWLAFRTMIAFARAADRGKPSWILTYGYSPHDSALLAGFVLAEGANFYENKGPQMADSVGAGFRTALFEWIAAHEADLYGEESPSHDCREVGLLYSARNRDLIDQVSGEPYNVEGSLHFAAYRTAAYELHRAHIPFDVVLDSDVDRFNHFQVLIAPHLALMSDATAAALQAFQGKLLTIGPTGSDDEWRIKRSRPALQGRSLVHFKKVRADLALAADSGLLKTTAPATMQIGLRSAADGYRAVLIHTGKGPAPSFTMTIRSRGRLPSAIKASLSAPTRSEVALSCRFEQADNTLCVTVPAGIETLALVALHCTFTDQDI